VKNLLSASVLPVLLALAGCGVPDLAPPPSANDTATSDKPVEAVGAPKVTNAPAEYPYADLALRGAAPGGAGTACSRSGRRSS